MLFFGGGQWTTTLTWRPPPPSMSLWQTIVKSSINQWMICQIFATFSPQWNCGFVVFRFFCVNAHFVFFYVLLSLLKHYLVFTDFGYFFKVSSLRFVFVWFNCYLNYFSGNAFSLGTFCYTLFSLVLLPGFSKFKSYGFAWYCINWCGTPVSQSLIVVLVELLDDTIAFETNK